MQTTGAGTSLGQQVERTGSAVLFVVVAVPTMFFWGYFVAAAGIDQWLHDDGGWYTPAVGIELTVLPLAALTAARLRWGPEAIDPPGESYSLWPPLLGTAVVCSAIWALLLGAVAFLVVPAAAVGSGLLQAPLRALVGRRGVVGSLADPCPATLSAAEPAGASRESRTPWLPWLGAAVAFAVIGHVPASGVTVHHPDQLFSAGSL